MALKPRIEITIVTPTSKWEFSMVKGRIMANGKPAPGPTKKQLDIASKAIRDICATESK
jgi:hypothetical protein